LGDLGAIDLKYDVAVSTAGGGSLDTILVDTAATGKQCIEFLKQHNIGRGNFLALDKTTRFQAACDHRQDYPLGAPRLFDLIRVSDPAVRTAFYHYLQDTLVATDIEQANKIAFGAVRYRVVTLGGELIEKVGTMTGGGRNKLRWDIYVFFVLGDFRVLRH
jgi:structural maintenance of chromosome 4